MLYCKIAFRVSADGAEFHWWFFPDLIQQSLLRASSNSLSTNSMNRTLVNFEGTLGLILLL